MRSCRFLFSILIIVLICFVGTSCDREFKLGFDVVEWALEKINNPFPASVSCEGTANIYDKKDSQKVLESHIQGGVETTITVSLVNPKQVLMKNSGLVSAVAYPRGEGEAIELTEADFEQYPVLTGCENTKDNLNPTLTINFTLKSESAKKFQGYDLHFNSNFFNADDAPVPFSDIVVLCNQKPLSVTRMSSSGENKKPLDRDVKWEFLSDIGRRTRTFYWRLDQNDFDRDIANIKIYYNKNGAKNGKTILLAADATEYTVPNITEKDVLDFRVSVVDKYGLESEVQVASGKESVDPNLMKARFLFQDIEYNHLLIETAFEDANNDKYSGCTVLVLNNANLTDEIVIKNSATVDLNGCTLYAASGKNAFRIEKGDVTFTDSSTAKSGKNYWGRRDCYRWWSCHIRRC